ncbi:putative MFS family arabinose efflux permease [Paraburkholderia atlantica]
MSTPSRTLGGNERPVKLTQGLIALFAFSCGAIVANLYYAQPITELIGPALHMSGGTASLIVSLTQIGYALGLFFIVPLGDLLENRKLMITTAVVSIASLAAASLMHTPSWFLLMSLLIGFSSVAVQILIPLAAHLAPDHSRGRIVGTIMGGLLLGILLSRPLSSIVADHFGWRVVFAAAAVVMALVTTVLALTIPRRQPDHSATYFELIGSLLVLVRTMPVLRHRALYQGLMFASFSLFWTAVPVELTRQYGLSQSAIALFSLVGAIGATSAPVAGRLADAGYSIRATFVALIVAALSYLPALVLPASGVFGLSRGYRDCARLRRADEHGARPAGDLRAARGKPQPPQRAVHDEHLRWRRDRVRACEHALRARWVAAGRRCCSCIPAGCVRPLPADRTAVRSQRALDLGAFRQGRPSSAPMTKRHGDRFSWRFSLYLVRVALPGRRRIE